MDAENRSEQIQRLRATYGPLLSEDKLDYLLQVQSNFQEVCDSQRAFGDAVEKSTQLLAIALSMDVETNLAARQWWATAAFDGGTGLLRLLSDKPLRNSFDPATDKEVALSKDFVDAISFVIENGIGFTMIAGALGHDFAEILKAGSLADAIFIPKASGWAQAYREPVGATEAD